MRYRALAAASLVLAASAAGTVDARGHLQTRQTRVELAAGTRAGRLVLANSGDAPLAAQIRVYRWTQHNGEDVLEPDTTLVPSPQVVEIGAGGEQLVRVVRSTTATPEHEEAYRIVVDELPGDPAKDATSAVAVRLRYMIPAFVRTADSAPEAVSCRVSGAMFACSNAGGRAAQLGASQVVDSRGQTIDLTSGLMGYVLAGSTRHFPFEADKFSASAAPRELKVRLNGLPTTLDLAVSP